MKMKKFLSIGALALTITTCTSMSAFAATSTVSKHDAFQSVVTKGLNGGKIFNGVGITANTTIGNYLTDNFINEANDVLGKYGVEIQSSDNYYQVQKKIALKMKSLDEKQKTVALGEIKDFLNEKMDLFVNSDDTEKQVDNYFKTSRYGKLTVGKNSNNDKTVSLENENGNILIQINSSNVYKAKAKLDSVNTYDELKELISSYYPDAEGYFNTIK